MKSKIYLGQTKIFWILFSSLSIFSLLFLGKFVSSAQAVDYSSLERVEVPAIYKWNLALFYPNNVAFQADKALVEKKIVDFKKNSGKLTNNTAIKKALDEYYGLAILVSRLSGYASKVYDSDTRNSEAIGLRKMTEKITNDFEGASSFLKPELLKLSDAKLKALAVNKSFNKFDVFLNGLIREKKHVLSEKEESILAKTGNLQNAPYNIYNTFLTGELPYQKAVLADGTEVVVSPYNYVKYRQSSNRSDRKLVFDNYFGAISNYKNTLAQTLSSQIEANIFRSQAKNFNTAIEEALYGNNLSVDYYKNLVARVNKELPLLWRYLALKKKVLGLDELRYNDLYAPINSSFSGVYPYNEGLDLVLEAVKPLGAEYEKQTKLTLTPGNGRIDIYPNLGKATGAYSAGDKADPVPYILMNYDDSYLSVSTLIHESGHSVHSYLANQNQSYLKTGYSTLIAETASTFNENLLLEYMLAHETDQEKRKELLGDSLETMRITLFRQAMFAEFELAIYTAAEEGTPLTAEYLNDTYLKLVKKYYGEAEGVVKVDDAYAIEWAQVPHFYFDYYVFNYVGGYLNGLELSAKALKDSAARDKYLSMLKAGGSAYPLDLLKKAGLDATSATAYDDAFKVIEQRVSELEKIVGK